MGACVGPCYIVRASTTNAQAAQVITAAVTSFASDTTSRDVGKKLAAAFVAANPQTPTQRAAMVTALAMGASDGLANDICRCAAKWATRRKK